MFKCLRCGYCCTLKVKLTFTEFLRIFLKGHRNFTENNIKGERCIKLINDKCFFLKGRNNCIIYDIRPKMCREYP